MPSLSLGIHIIAREEEELLPRCLQSVAELCDELIVVDTGSKDRTKQIAQSYGAKVISMEWNDDFAAARNLALEETKSDWVFFIDADEWLQSDIQSVRDCLRDPNAIGYWVTINNEIGPNKEDLVTHESLRLFRAHPAYRFSGRIHEEIIHSILANHSPDRIKKSAISIGHSGYRPERIKQKK